MTKNEIRGNVLLVKHMLAIVAKYALMDNQDWNRHDRPEERADYLIIQLGEITKLLLKIEKAVQELETND